MKKLLRYEGLVLVLMVAVLLRTPSLFEPYWYGDEQIYLTVGQGIKKGLVLYRDITDYPNKPPLIYLAAAATGTVFWFRWLLMIWNLVHVVIVNAFLKKLVPERRLLVWGGSLLFVLLTSLPAWEGNIANSEIFMIMPVTAGMFLLWQSKDKKNLLKIFTSGLLLSMGFLFKIPVVVDVAAAGLFFWIFRSRLRDLPKLVTDKSLWVWALGFGLPIGLTLLLWQLQGVAPEELIKNAVGSVGYVSAWSAGFSTLKSRLGLVVVLTGLLYWLRRKLSGPVLFGCVWLVWTLFGATLSGRPYPHYFIQTIVPAVVLVVNLWPRRKWADWVAGGLVLVLAGLTLVRFGVRHYPITGYYINFGKFILGQRGFEAYIASFDKRMPRNYQLAYYLKMHTDPAEKIYIWGTQPDVYAMSGRLPAGRLTVSFHVEDLDAYDKTMAWMTQERPKYVVMMTDEQRRFEQLEALLAVKYVEVRRIGEAKIYRRGGG